MKSNITSCFKNFQQYIINNNKIKLKFVFPDFRFLKFQRYIINNRK